MSEYLVDINNSQQKTPVSAQNITNQSQKPKKVFLHHGNSMDIALDKGICIRFKTREGTGVIKSFIPYYDENAETYKRNYKNHKKGDKKAIKYEVMKDSYKSLPDAWKAVGDDKEYSFFIQTSTGRTHYLREVLVLDFDANKYFPPLFDGTPYGYRTFNEAEKDIHAFVKKYKLPKQSYIYYNHKSGNIQVGWFFHPSDSVRYNARYNENGCRTYLSLGHALADLWSYYKGMPGDTHFTGWQCKNPYNKNTEIKTSKIYFRNTSSLEKNFNTLYEVLEPYFPKPGTKEIEDEINLNLLENVIVDVTNRTTYNIHPTASSRNYYEMKCLREWIWEYMRKHSDNAPLYGEARNALNVIEAYADSLLPGKDKKTVSELDAVCKNVYKWSLAKYKKSTQKRYTDEQRRKGILYKKACKYSNMLRLSLLPENLTCREAAKKLGMSRTTVSRYRNMSEKEIEHTMLYASQMSIENAESIARFNKGNKKFGNKYVMKSQEIEKLEFENSKDYTNEIDKIYKKEKSNIQIKSTKFLLFPIYYNIYGTNKHNFAFRKKILSPFMRLFTEKIRLKA